MKDLAKKVAVGVATGALMAQSLVLPSLAEIKIIVNGNGSNTEQEVNVASQNSTTVTQSNDAHVENNVKANANSGDNDASDNTGGDVNIDTGEAKSVVDVSNKLNSNEASVTCGGCPTDVSVEVSGNGTHSDSDVNLSLDNTKWVTQDNHAKVENNIDVKSNSGKNEADDNTGGDVNIDTGKATAWADVSTTANANVAHIGGNGDGALELLVTGNGSYSEQELNVALSNTTGIDQNNWANIENDVEVKANSGKNEADDNTGGSGSIDTGDAWAGASVDTLANLNVAHVEDCCELDGLVKVAGNGTDSDSDVNLALDSTLYATQDNDYSCGGHRKPRFLGLEELFGRGYKKDDCSVDVKADSGRNDLDDNTGDPGGDPSIDTGKASTEVEVNTEANSNVFSTGDALPELPDWEWDGSANWWMWLLAGHTN